MIGLTIHAPWASLIAFGIKPIENRTWYPPECNLGVRMAIHQGKTWDRDGEEMILDSPEMTDSLKREILEHARASQGAIVATAILDGWYDQRNGRALGVNGDVIRASNWFFGPVGWKFSRRRRLDPWVPHVGYQGLWKVRQDLVPGLLGIGEETP